MGMHDKEPQMADAAGIPEYFATHVRMEDVGGGCVRIYNCTLHGRVLIPHYSVVFPAEFLVAASKKVHEVSRQVFLAEHGQSH